MSLSFLRDSVLAKLQKRVDDAVHRSVNMRVQPEMSSDQYAMAQVDTLSEARAFGEAAVIVIAEYKRMTEAEQKAEETAVKAKAENIYG